MKSADVKVGATYLAKVSDRVVPVRIDAPSMNGGWDGTNLVTEKKVRIKTSQRLRCPANRNGSAQAEATTEPVDAPPDHDPIDDLIEIEPDPPTNASLSAHRDREALRKSLVEHNANPDRAFDVVWVGDPELDPAAKHDPAPSYALSPAEADRRHRNALNRQAEQAQRLEALRTAAAEAATEDSPDTERNGSMSTKKKTAAPKAAKKAAKTIAAPKAPKAGEKKMSGLDAAARVLAEAGTALNPVEIMEAITKKGYWSSPNGKTPHATIAAAMMREIAVKGKESRFEKAAERGKFAAK